MWSFELLSEVFPAPMEQTQAGSVIAQNIKFLACTSKRHAFDLRRLLHFLQVLDEA